TRFAPKRAAANARIPEPVPRSSSVHSFSGEWRLPACWARLPAEPLFKGLRRQAAGGCRVAACAPQNRVHRSNKRNDIAVVVCSPVPKAAPAGISKVLFLFLFLLVTDLQIISRFPILIGLVVCARENVVSESRGNFTIVPPKRERIFSKSRRLLPAISTIAFLRPGLERIASRWPATSPNAASLAA